MSFKLTISTFKSVRLIKHTNHISNQSVSVQLNAPLYSFMTNIAIPRLKIILTIA
jgi:hypothetical protein